MKYRQREKNKFFNRSKNRNLGNNDKIEKYAASLAFNKHTGKNYRRFLKNSFDCQ